MLCPQLRLRLLLLLLLHCLPVPWPQSRALKTRGMGLVSGFRRSFVVSVGREECRLQQGWALASRSPLGGHWSWGASQSAL